MYNSFTCWQSFGMLCHVVISWDKEGTVGWFVFVSLLIGGNLQKAPCSPTKNSQSEMWGTPFQNNVQKSSHFDLGPIPSIHSFVHTSTHSFNHHLQMYLISYIKRNIHIRLCAQLSNHSSIHPSLMHASTRLSVLCFVWSSGSANVNKIVK